MAADASQDSKVVSTKDWTVERHGVIDEIVGHDDSTRWKVRVWDEDREPFLTKFFNTKEAAFHFLKKVKKGT